MKNVLQHCNEIFLILQFCASRLLIVLTVVKKILWILCKININ